MGARKVISVSALKARLLEIVRDVEKGDSFDVTKDGIKVCVLQPVEDLTVPAVGFASVEILDNLLDPIPETWTFDSKNLKRKK